MPRLACPGLEAIVCGERQVAWIVDWPAVFPACHHHFHVVIEASGRNTPQMLEGSHMLAYRRFKVLSFGKADILPPRISQDIAEQFYAATPLLREVNRVCRPIHLGLSTRQSFKANHWSVRLRTMTLHKSAESRVTALVTQLAQLLEGPLCCDIWITSEQLIQGFNEWPEL